MRLSFASTTILALAGALGLSGAACGGSSGENPPLLGGQSDAGSGYDGGDSNAPVIVDPSYPAAHAPMPLVDFNGGGIVSGIKVITVTFDGDPLRSEVESFGDTITQSPWWTAVASEYCAPANSGTCVTQGVVPDQPHVHIATPASATYADSSSASSPSSVVTFIQSHIADGSFPKPDAQTLYVIYFPTGTTVSLDGAQSCVGGGFAGYHKSTKVTPVGSGTLDALYAIVPRCTVEPKTEAETVTFSASHEIIEAATDPYVTADAVGYYMMDPAWGLLGGEVADLCEDLSGAGLDTVVESGFTVQRSWSNASARAGHNPCVPIPPGEVYFNLAPAAAASGQSTATMQLSLGSSATFEATAFSDGPMDNWEIKGLDFAALQGTTPSLAFAFDTPVVNNGTKVKVTVTLKTAAQQQARTSSGVVSVEPFFLESRYVSASGAKTVRLWPGIVIQN